MDELIRITKESLKRIQTHPQFLEWASGSSIEESDLAIINNSFVFRDVATKKSEYYLALECMKDGQFKDQLFVVSGLGRINKDFKLLKSKNPNLPKLVSLSEAIASQISSIGHIVFALISSEERDLEVEEQFMQGPFSSIVWNPTQEELLTTDKETLIISNTTNEDKLWSELTLIMEELNIDIPGKMKTDFGSVLDKLQSRAVARINLPSSSDEITDSVTDAIVDLLKEHRDSYSKALEACDPDDPSNSIQFNEILRLSYNFAGDASTYLRLIVSICDLKPLILWLTIGEHYRLSEAFRQLPWARSKYKPSLKNYIDTVSDARNRRFHDAFPFQKALRLSLPPSAVQNPEIQFFSEYAPRANLNEFTFRDKALVDILLKFTRARQRPVSSSFWNKNIAVMDSIIDLFEATSKALKRIYAETHKSSS